MAVSRRLSSSTDSSLDLKNVIIPITTFTKEKLPLLKEVIGSSTESRSIKCGQNIYKK